MAARLLPATLQAHDLAAIAPLLQGKTGNSKHWLMHTFGQYAAHHISILLIINRLAHLPSNPPR